jgi:hypothetical protein
MAHDTDMSKHYYTQADTMTYHITFKLSCVWKTTILLYVPGEGRMDPKTEVRLYPCGDAHFAPMARVGIRPAVWSTLDSTLHTC